MVKLCPGFALIARDIFSLYVDDGCPRFAPRSKPVESNCSSEPPVNLRRLSAGDARAACLAEGARVCDKHSYELTKSQVLQSPLIRLSVTCPKILLILCWTHLQRTKRQVGNILEVVWLRWTATKLCFHLSYQAPQNRKVPTLE